MIMLYQISSLRKQTQCGFSMIEVLVTIMILAIGLLGLAALQSRGQQFNHAAYIRTHATLLAYDIMEKIRINEDFAQQDVAEGASNGKGYVAAVRPSSSLDCFAENCTPAQLRTHDLSEWYDRLSATLPAGSGQITADNSTTPIIGYTVTITWALRDNERNTGVETDKRSLSWQLQL